MLKLPTYKTIQAKRMTNLTFKQKSGIICLTLIWSTFASNNSVFQQFDNNITAGVSEIMSNQNYTATTLNVDGQVLFDNNIWLHVNAGTELAYSVNVNSNPNIAKLYNNAAGSIFAGQFGYAFQAGDRWNFIPHIGLGYSNFLAAYNENSVQQFIIEDPGINYSIGAKTELLLIPNTLKFATDLNYIYSQHHSVLPNDFTTNTLEHQGYTINTVQIRPELQWNVTNKFTIIGYYQFATLFGGTANAADIYYPQVGVSSNQIIKNNQIQNTFGLNFGIPF